MFILTISCLGSVVSKLHKENTDENGKTSLTCIGSLKLLDTVKTRYPFTITALTLIYESGRKYTLREGNGHLKSILAQELKFYTVY